MNWFHLDWLLCTPRKTSEKGYFCRSKFCTPTPGNEAVISETQVINSENISNLVSLLFTCLNVLSYCGNTYYNLAHSKYLEGVFLVPMG